MLRRLQLDVSRAQGGYDTGGDGGDEEFEVIEVKTTTSLSSSSQGQGPRGSAITKVCVLRGRNTESVRACLISEPTCVSSQLSYPPSLTLYVTATLNSSVDTSCAFGNHSCTGSRRQMRIAAVNAVQGLT